MKTPKEKAKDIVNRMTQAFGYSSEDSLNAAHILALEIIDEYENNICQRGYDNDWEMWESRKQYWQQVKAEIENL